jgi:hypothetical protein
MALAKFMWATATYGSKPSVEVFSKNFCRHWQKKVVGGKIMQFGSCTFTPGTRKTSGEVVEIDPCAKKQVGELVGFLVLFDIEGCRRCSEAASVHTVLALLRHIYAI